MRAIHLARLDKVRPVLVLTRDIARPHMSKVTVAPITSTVRGLTSEFCLSARNGLDHDCVASLDNVVTIPVVDLLSLVGFVFDDQEGELSKVVARAFDLR